MPRGGRRKGTPGKGYAQRTDLLENRGTLPPTAVPGQTYGKAAKQIEAQKQVPMAAPPGPLPGSLTPLDAPTQRPHEPVTAGIPLGAGPGPEALRTVGVDPVEDELRAIYAAHPNEHLRELIEDMERER